jgi:lipopolysaccharide biosynthesis glycosyltransferase
MLKIFVGYDPKEAVAYHTCVNSIIRHASKPVSIIPLALNILTEYQEAHTDGSNTFTYTIFLVPYLADNCGWAVYIDGDMILKEDITKLCDLREDDKAVMVVKHDYKTKSPNKYFGTKNINYPRKNWSSVILWNCNHSKNLVLTPAYVSNATGEFMHRFNWLADRDIGSLPSEWNWLADEYGINDDAKLIHYTLGTPCFAEYADCPMASDWHKEYNYATQISM